MRWILAFLLGATLFMIACTTSLSGGAVADCEAFDRQNIQDECYSKLGILRADLNLCDKTSTEGSKFYCYEKIAETTNTSTPCSQINMTYWSDICYKHFGAQDNDASLCLKIEHDDTRDDCFYDVGRDTLNNKWCQQVRRYADSVACFSHVGKVLNDPAQCDIMGMPERDICKYNVAVGTHTIEFCKQISFNKMRARCEERVNERLNETTVNETINLSVERPEETATSAPIV